MFGGISRETKKYFIVSIQLDHIRHGSIIFSNSQKAYAEAYANLQHKFQDNQVNLRCNFMDPKLKSPQTKC